MKMPALEYGITRIVNEGLLHGLDVEPVRFVSAQTHVLASCACLQALKEKPPRVAKP